MILNGHRVKLESGDTVVARIGGVRRVGSDQPIGFEAFFSAAYISRNKIRMLDPSGIDPLCGLDTSEKLEQVLELMAWASGLRLNRVEDTGRTWVWKFF
jgi:hypothetical protein